MHVYWYLWGILYDTMQEENIENTLSGESLGSVQEGEVSTELNTEVLDITPSTEVDTEESSGNSAL